MKKLNLIWPLILVALLSGCNDKVKDEEVPVIDMTGENASPQNCGSVYIGDNLHFKARFTDNEELGSFSIEMHHNFDHHTHSTSAHECDYEPNKTPDMPFLHLSQQSIPEGLKTYDADVVINIPEGVDTGDYHFMVRLTDKAGWQTFKGMSVKLLRRNN